MNKYPRRFFVALILLLISTGWASAEQAQPEYRVQTKVWMNGELRGEPSLQVEAGKEAMVSMGRSDGESWRMNVLVEDPDEFENAMESAIWLNLSIEEQIDGEWTFLTDTILGLPAGQRGNISVVDEGMETATPENAKLFVEVIVKPVKESVGESG